MEAHHGRKLGELALTCKNLLADKEAAEKVLQDYQKDTHDKQEKHAQKTPWWYLIALIFIGSAEWMINYSSFFATFSVPMFAAGLTLLVAVFVAFASHSFGTLIKQPIAQEELNFNSEARKLGALFYYLLSGLGLLLSLVAVAWNRYVWMSEIVSYGVQEAIWPKVLITLAGNLIVFLLGCLIAWTAHSEGRYTPARKKMESADRKYDSAKRKLDKRRGKIRDHCKDEDRPSLIEEIDKLYEEHNIPLSSFLLVLVLGYSLCNTPAHAQILGSEYNIDKFCDQAFLAEAKPFRKTIVYVDETLIHPEAAQQALPSSSDLTRWQRAAANGFLEMEWYEQLETKLRASLLPSENVSIIGIDAGGAPRERAQFCWPGFTDEQLLQIQERSLWRWLVESDPLEGLDTQRAVFFGKIRQALAEGLSEGTASNRSRSYVRALSRDEARIRSSRDLFVRVIWFGHMIEESDFGSIRDSADVSELARKVNESLSMRLGGASFYVYGVEKGALQERAEKFWGGLIRASQGQLGAFGADLALPAEVPSKSFQLELEIEVPEPEKNRAGRATILTSEDGEIVDGAIVIAGFFRSSLVGMFACDEALDICSAQCRLDAETRHSVVFEGLDQESISLDGFAASLQGYIGEPDDGRPESHRSFAHVKATISECT